MRGGSIAKRYALALLSLSKQEGTIDAVEQELTQLNGLIGSTPEFRGILESPLVRPSEKKRWWLQVAQKMQVSEAVQNLLLTLIDHERVSLLPLLTLLYRDMADEELSRVRVQVKSAISLGSLQDQLKSSLEKSLKCTVLLEAQIDPTLLGGFIVKIKDRLLDASLRNDLHLLKEKIAKQAVS